MPWNLKCMCRQHHLLKTFWAGPDGWTDRQLPDGTVIWTAPTGRTYTTRLASHLFVPTWCAPTTPTPTPWQAPPGSTERGLMMPTRRRTHAAQCAHAIHAERALNDAHVAEPSQPPPF